MVKRNGKIDCCFIRKSTKKQDESGQRANVEKMLKALGVHVPEDHFFVGTVSRRKVKANAHFNELMELVEAGRVRVVYVESQDRWGTKDRVELFSLFGILRKHNTKLYDLRNNKDLTDRDFTTELMAFINSVKSEKELQDISYRSLRSRVAFFVETGSWPTGTHPYGYGKACYAADGTLKWVWQPHNRSIGDLFYPSPDGKLTPGPTDVPIPRKSVKLRDVLKLVPSNNPDFVRAVKLTFDMYVRLALSRRQISARLNAENLKFNGKPFSHAAVTTILGNQAYQGDTHFGKVQTGELHTFDKEGLIVEVKDDKSERKHRDAEHCLVKTDTHEPLVDRKTFKLAQEKLTAETERTCHAPRNPKYYLKQLFVCGHCGQNMQGRTENGDQVVYVCSTYLKGRQNGQPSSCGYHRITHEGAEQLLLDKIKELNLPFDQVSSEGARANLDKRLALLGHEDEESQDRWFNWLEEGVRATADYLKDAYDLDDDSLASVTKSARLFYRWGGKLPRTRKELLPVAFAEFKKAVVKAEEEAVKHATDTLAQLREQHRQITLNWAKATDEMQHVLKAEIDAIELQIREWEPRTLGVSQRLNKLLEAERERQAEREQLLIEWPTIEEREKGEALRRLFKTVKLYWDREFHEARENPSRSRKTDRKGRYSYTLKTLETQWSFTASDSVGTW